MDQRLTFMVAAFAVVSLAFLWCQKEVELNTASKRLEQATIQLKNTDESLAHIRDLNQQLEKQNHAFMKFVIRLDSAFQTKDAEALQREKETRAALKKSDERLRQKVTGFNRTHRHLPALPVGDLAETK